MKKNKKSIDQVFRERKEKEMEHKRELKQIADDFKSDMQKIADEGNLKISVSTDGENYQTIAEPKKKNMDPKKSKNTKEYLQYKFSHDEIHAKGQELARISSEIVELKEEKKAAVAAINAKIAASEAEVSTLGKHINNGYEYRYIDCVVSFHDPNTGMKTTRRLDTGEVVKKESMTEFEMQGELDFGIEE